MGSVTHRHRVDGESENWHADSRGTEFGHDDHVSAWGKGKKAQRPETEIEHTHEGVKQENHPETGDAIWTVGDENEEGEEMELDETTPAGEGVSEGEGADEGDTDTDTDTEGEGEEDGASA